MSYKYIRTYVPYICVCMQCMHKITLVHLCYHHRSYGGICTSSLLYIQLRSRSLHSATYIVSHFPKKSPNGCAAQDPSKSNRNVPWYIFCYGSTLSLLGSTHSEILEEKSPCSHATQAKFLILFSYLKSCISLNFSHILSKFSPYPPIFQDKFHSLRMTFCGALLSYEHAVNFTIIFCVMHFWLFASWFNIHAIIISKGSVF